MFLWKEVEVKSELIVLLFLKVNRIEVIYFMASIVLYFVGTEHRGTRALSENWNYDESVCRKFYFLLTIYLENKQR